MSSGGSRSSALTARVDVAAGERRFRLARAHRRCRRRRNRRAARRARPLPFALRAWPPARPWRSRRAAAPVRQSRRACLVGGRNADGGEQSCGRERGFEQALEEIVGLDACACRSARAMSISPPSASRQAGSSAAGSAKAIEPPMVPRLRIAGCAICGIASAISGACLRDVVGAFGLRMARQRADLDTCRS